MKPETAEWVKKAEGDYTTASRERKAQVEPNYDASCFHAQQCAEKYLKARLVEAGISFPKVHDLEALLNILLPIEPDWDLLRDPLRDLTDMGVEVRYPGFSADVDDAQVAFSAATTVRKAVRASFLLGDTSQ